MNIFSKYFLMMIPLLLCMVVSVKNSELNNMEKYYDSTANGVSDSKSIISKDKPSSSLDIESFDSDGDKNKYRRSLGVDYVEIDDKKYLKWYYDMTYKWNDFEGERFRFLATVFKPENGNQYVVLGRLGMVCCMADLQPCGFIYNGKGYESLRKGEWYWVTAKIKENKKYTYNYEKLPMAYDIKIEKARKPTDEYVYIQ